MLLLLNTIMLKREKISLAGNLVKASGESQENSIIICFVQSVTFITLLLFVYEIRFKAKNASSFSLN